jgi:hypothetical protein
MTSRSENCTLGVRDPEPSCAAVALIEDEVPVLTPVCRNSDVTARKNADDAAPEAIADDEPTVPINLRRAGLRIAILVHLDDTHSSD